MMGVLAYIALMTVLYGFAMCMIALAVARMQNRLRVLEERHEALDIALKMFDKPQQPSQSAKSWRTP